MLIYNHKITKRDRENIKKKNLRVSYFTIHSDPKSKVVKSIEMFPDEMVWSSDKY